MCRLSIIFFTILVLGASPALAGISAPQELKDLYFGEVLFYAFQDEWFDAIARLDTELDQHHGVDEPQRDSLYYHIDYAEFAVGDFELAYRMHQRAGRAISAVIEGNVTPLVRNEAIYRLARLYFHKAQPVKAQQAVERIRGEVPETIKDDLAFLKAQILMANGRYADAVPILKELEHVERLNGFAAYNLGISLIKDGQVEQGRTYLDLTGQMHGSDPSTKAISDKSNLVLGTKLLEERRLNIAKQVLDRVHMTGPFSNRALLGSGWSDAFQNNFKRAMVPWSILASRQVTDDAVQEALLALPYAYGKLEVYSKAAVLYGNALAKFSVEIDKLDLSIESIRGGHFLEALVREELKQDANWVVKLRQLPQTPETYYLLDLMASHDFQESLKNYLDLETLRKKLETWESNLDAFEQIIAQRRAYYEPLLPTIDREFRRLDSQIRLRLEQRDYIQKRLQGMLTMPRPDFLVTAQERIYLQKIERLVYQFKNSGQTVSPGIADRLQRLRGVLLWDIHTEYDRRLTEAHKHLKDLNDEIAVLKEKYDSFVRSRQAATQSYVGYDDGIRYQRFRIKNTREAIGTLMAEQGQMLETMAVNELDRRREQLIEFQIKARFAMADSYDRATRKKAQEKLYQ